MVFTYSDSIILNQVSTFTTLTSYTNAFSLGMTDFIFDWQSSVGTGTPVDLRNFTITYHTCGDGVISAGEECDHTSLNLTYCNSTCQVVSGATCTPTGASTDDNDCYICGNTFLEPLESCDFGAGSQACVTCLGLEPGWICDASPSHDSDCSLCGDGAVGFSESCDLGSGSVACPIC